MSNITNLKHKNTFIDLEKEELKCNFLECLAGLGIAGNGVCFLGGTPDRKQCKQFIDEKKWLKKRGLED